MSLTLTVLRCPDRVAPETRRVGGGDLVLGRGPGADWVLADPAEKPQISRRHCTLSYAGGAWTLLDTSTNGTALNGEPALVGKPSRPLRDGDRLRLGPYEIEVGLAAGAPAAAPMGAAFPQSGFSQDHGLQGGSPFREAPADESPFGASAFAPGPFGASDHAGDHFAPASVRLPDDFGAELFDAPPTRPAAQQDHTPAQSDVFLPPQVRSVLPSGWDAGLDDPPVPASRPGPATADRTEPAPAPAGKLPADFLGADFLAPEPPASAAPLPSPAPAPLAPEIPAAAGPAPGDHGLLSAFLEGADMADARPADPAATMREAGAAFRAFVHGLRRVLMARAEIKSAFRIDQTMVRSRGNNPLKFSAGDDDALAALLGAGRRTDMRASAAVEGALTDIRQHELASMAAMQDAVRELLGKLDPGKFRAAAEGGLLPAQRKARAFDLYEAEFGKLREALSEKLDDAFGRAFAVAYERVVADLQMREPPK